MKYLIKKKLNFVTSVIMVFSMFFLAGCSMHSGYIGHATVTNVELESKNFKVVDSVLGEASAEYIFGFGPLEQDLFNRARRDMISKADLIGHSKAIVNLTTDFKIHTFFPFWFKKTIYVSGEVIEFY